MVILEKNVKIRTDDPLNKLLTISYLWSQADPSLRGNNSEVARFFSKVFTAISYSKESISSIRIKHYREDLRKQLKLPIDTDSLVESFPLHEFLEILMEDYQVETSIKSDVLRQFKEEEDYVKSTILNLEEEFLDLCEHLVQEELFEEIVDSDFRLYILCILRLFPSHTNWLKQIPLIQGIFIETIQSSFQWLLSKSSFMNFLSEAAGRLGKDLQLTNLITILQEMFLFKQKVMEGESEPTASIHVQPITSKDKIVGMNIFSGISFNKLVQEDRKVFDSTGDLLERLEKAFKYFLRVLPQLLKGESYTQKIQAMDNEDKDLFYGMIRLYYSDYGYQQLIKELYRLAIEERSRNYFIVSERESKPPRRIYIGEKSKTLVPLDSLIREKSRGRELNEETERELLDFVDLYLSDDVFRVGLSHMVSFYRQFEGLVILGVELDGENENIKATTIGGKGKEILAIYHNYIGKKYLENSGK